MCVSNISDVFPSGVGMPDKLSLCCCFSLKAKNVLFTNN